MNSERTIKSAAADAAGKIHDGVNAAEDKLDESVDAMSSRGRWD